MSLARIRGAFERCQAENRAAFVAFAMAGDPDPARAVEIIASLPGAGADIVEIGMPFTDPMADGASIQAAGQRALDAGATFGSVLEAAKAARAAAPDTPLIAMGYMNAIHRLGAEGFAQAASAAGIDGAIVVDLPPEEDDEVRAAFNAHDMALVRLLTPTTRGPRLARALDGASGFIYYVSVTGVTGAGIGAADAVEAHVDEIRAASGLPVVVGFGVRTPEQAAGFGRFADGVVVGSAIVDAAGAGDRGKIQALVESLSAAVRGARASG